MRQVLGAAGTLVLVATLVPMLISAGPAGAALRHRAHHGMHHRAHPGAVHRPLPGRCAWQAAAPRSLDARLALAGELTARLTLDQKLGIIALKAAPGIENINAPIPRLCIPALTLSDGPNGISNHTPASLQLPASIGVAASFDPEVAFRYGEVEGSEARRKGIDVVQGPELNLARVPVSGRIFEAYGEDPLLTAEMGVADIRGIQSEHVMADAKHFTAYNQETSRPRLDELVTPRVLAELYNAPFAAAVEQGHVASIMCSYGAINGINDCSDPSLYADLSSWGFTGFVRSDLESVTNPAAAFHAGLDLLKPASVPELAALVRRGAISLGEVNRAVDTVLGEMAATGVLNHPPRLDPAAPAITPTELSIARWAAERSMVLLKNRGGILPLKRSLSSLAVIGIDATTDPRTAGLGSAHVSATGIVTPLAGLTAALPRARVTSAPGGVAMTTLPVLGGEVHAAHEVETTSSQPGSADLGIVTAGHAAASLLTATAPGRGPGWRRWATTIEAPATGTYELSFRQYGDTWCRLDNRLIFASAGLHGPAWWSTTVRLRAHVGEHLALSWYAIKNALPPRIGLVDVSPLIAHAAAVARAAKVAVVFVSDWTEEGADRPSLSLPGDADALISAVAAANKNTVVVLNTSGAVLMPWLDRVKAVLEAWYPGQDDGSAIASVLFGDVNPSGHLPETFPTSLTAIPTASPAQFPGVGGKVSYSEGLDVGYRWYDANHITPLFPFGYGLSYTTFRFSHLKITPRSVINGSSGPDTQLGQTAPLAHVTASITNTGNLRGSDVAQLYIADPKIAGEPPRQLQGFHRVTLLAHQTKTVSFTITGHKLSFFNTKADGWTVPNGRYGIYVGDSSALASLPLRGRLNITSTIGARYARLAIPATVDPGSTFTAKATFVNHGNLPINQGIVALGFPSGWKVVRLARTRNLSLAPGHSTIRYYRVTVPDQAEGEVKSLTAQLLSQGIYGAGDLSSTATITVRGPITVSAAAPLVVGPAVTAPATVTVTSLWNRNVVVHLNPSLPAGVTIAPASPTVLVPAHKTVSLTFSVSVAPGTPPATDQVPLVPSFTYRGRSYPLAAAALTVAIPYGSLQAAFNNAGISDDSNIAAANFDGNGNSYSQQALTAAGLAPGTTLTADGASLQWPGVPAGTPDNALAAGQTIAMPASTNATELVVLGASSGADQTGSGLVEYTDGTIQPYTLTLDDWFNLPNDPSNTVVATAAYLNDSTGAGNNGTVGRRNHKVRVFATAIQLQPAKTVASITLPNVATLPGVYPMHVFALGLG